MTLDKRVDLGPADSVQPGDYLVENVSGAQLLVLGDGGRMEPLANCYPLDPATDYNGKKILLMRAGGFGDLVLLTPVLREIKRRWPACILRVSTMRHYAPALANLPFVDEVVPYPLPADIANDCDAAVYFEDAIERNPRARKLHMTELFAEIAGIKDIPDLRPAYRVKATEGIWANEAYPRVNGTRRICVQVHTSAVCRDYPKAQLGAVVGELCKKGWEVFLMGDPGRVKLPDAKPVGLRNLTEAGLTFRQSCAVVNGSDCVLGSDSALIHVAGALGVPAVGLYGPFPWKLRTAHSPSVTAIQGHAACEPCFHHVNTARRNHFPEHCPSAAKGHCQVLASIDPARVVAMVEKVARDPHQTTADTLQGPLRG